MWGIECESFCENRFTWKRNRRAQRGWFLTNEFRDSLETIKAIRSLEEVSSLADQLLLLFPSTKNINKIIFPLRWAFFVSPRRSSVRSFCAWLFINSGQLTIKSANLWPTREKIEERNENEIERRDSANAIRYWILIWSQMSHSRDCVWLRGVRARIADDS